MKFHKLIPALVGPRAIEEQAEQPKKTTVTVYFWPGKSAEVNLTLFCLALTAGIWVVSVMANLAFAYDTDSLTSLPGGEVWTYAMDDFINGVPGAILGAVIFGKSMHAMGSNFTTGAVGMAVGTAIIKLESIMNALGYSIAYVPHHVIGTFC